MKLLDRVLLWVLSVSSVLLGLLFLLLILALDPAWIRADAVWLPAGTLALIGIASAVALLLRCGGGRQGKGEAALVDGGENGSAYVTLNVLGDMAKRIALDTEGIRSCKAVVTSGASGVDVAYEIALHPGVAVAPLAVLLQERLKDRIFEMAGIRVGRVSILVEAAGEGDKPKEEPIKLLPGGDK